MTARASLNSIAFTVGSTTVRASRGESEVSGRCTASGPRLGGTSRLGSLRIGSSDISVGDVPLTLALGDGFVLHVNWVGRESNSSFERLTRRALWLETPDGAVDRVFAESSVGRTVYDHDPCRWL